MYHRSNRTRILPTKKRLHLYDILTAIRSTLDEQPVYRKATISKLGQNIRTLNDLRIQNNTTNSSLCIKNRSYSQWISNIHHLANDLHRTNLRNSENGITARAIYTCTLRKVYIAVSVDLIISNTTLQTLRIQVILCERADGKHMLFPLR